MKDWLLSPTVRQNCEGKASELKVTKCGTLWSCGVKSGTMRAMDHLLNLLRGAASAIVLLPKSRNYRVDSHGFDIDAQRLRGDFSVVGRGLRKQLKRESANYRAR